MVKGREEFRVKRRQVVRVEPAKGERVSKQIKHADWLAEDRGAYSPPPGQAKASNLGLVPGSVAPVGWYFGSAAPSLHPWPWPWPLTLGSRASSACVAIAATRPAGLDVGLFHSAWLGQNASACALAVLDSLRACLGAVPRQGVSFPSGHPPLIFGHFHFAPSLVRKGPCSRVSVDSTRCVAQHGHVEEKKK